MPIVFVMQFITMHPSVVILLLGVVLAQGIKDFRINKHIIRVGGPKIQILATSEEKDGSSSVITELFSSKHDLEEPYQNCNNKKEGSICFEWGEPGKSVKFELEDSNLCVLITGTTEEEGGRLEAYVNFEDDQWFGGPERYLQEWPVQNIDIQDDLPYVTRPDNQQGVLESYWVSSTGRIIYVYPNTSLFINSNHEEYKGYLGLIAENKAPYKPRNISELRFDLCKADNIIEAQNYAINEYFEKPVSHPGKKMMTLPTYSTWAEYKSDINQDKVLEFTNQILENNFKMGAIEIDDKWETCYGTLEFDTKRFPNITQLTDYIHSKGGRATAWVTPFINVECEFFQQALSEGRLILNTNTSSVTSWWNGNGGVVDVTNTTTKDWWVRRLKNLQKSSGLDGFKFDAGETGWLPQLPEITGDPLFYPEFYVRNYVEAAAEFGEDIEVRVGHQTHNVPLFIRMLDKDSRWGLDNGLQSVVTTAFQMGLTGYPFILPDMIGGNAYGEAPSKELFIRWVEASALLPAMQFSLLPWDYDQETTDISRRYLELHTNYSQQLLDASEVAIATGRPIITPIWWDSPEDPETYPINNEYLLGNITLVAPVLEDGVRERDIYLPNGKWIDSRQQTFQGPAWLRNYSAPLDFLPLFTKV